MKNRYLSAAISEDALKDKKIAFISGPRQVGKTTMGKSLLKSKNNDFNWDQSSFKRIWTKSPEKTLKNIDSSPVLFDEIHKDKKWKSKIKGIYDSFSDKLEILVVHYSKLLKTKLNFQLVDTKNYDKKHILYNVRVMSYEKFFSGLV